MARKNHTPPKNFEDAVSELEEILASIEGGELGLEETLLKYERGNFLVQHCREVLNAAEKQIEMISKGPDGGVVVQGMVEAEAPAADEDLAGEDSAR
jgi:exodeoxyribonuclease VII small subunit